MDERLQKALEHSNYSITIANQKKNLKNRFQQQLLVHHAGGVFCADQQTLCFVSSITGNSGKYVILDTKENPIKIDDIDELRAKLWSAYHNASLEYENEFSKIKRVRKLDKLTEL